MTPLFFNLICPHHKTPLEWVPETASYVCETGCNFETKNQIPRFVGPENYAESFGLQWNQFRLTQLDSFTGLSISRDRLTRIAGGSLDIFRDQTVLEAGCGAGRFTEILLQSHARVLAVDLSTAVEANYANCHQYENYSVIQADLACLPVAPSQFDVVLCIGVIQHTPCPENTIAALCGYVKPGGLLLIDHYSRDYPLTGLRRFLRHYLIKTSPSFSIGFCRLLVAVLWPIHRSLWRFRSNRYVNKLRQGFVIWSPVVDYQLPYAELGNELLYAWAMLDTHDTLTDHYKHLRSAEEIEMTLQSMGMEKIETIEGGNGVEARACKPMKT